MTLIDLRKLAIKKQQKIRFTMKNGLECVMDQRGVALIPALNNVPDFNLDQEFAAAMSFVLEPLAAAGQKNAPKSRSLTRTELDALINTAPSAGGHHDDHDDDGPVPEK